MNKAILDAIREGEAVLEEKKRQEALKKAEELKEKQKWEAESRMRALAWVQDTLPFVIREETAKGHRNWSTTDEFIAEAARKIGLKVTEQGQERSMDEGVDWGSYWIIYW